MKNLISILLLLAAMPACAQKLSKDINDTETHAIIKETQWQKLRCKDGSLIRIKMRRYGAETRAYWKFEKRGPEVKCDKEESYVQVLLDNGEQLHLVIPKLKSGLDMQWEGLNETAIPFGLVTEPLTRDELAALEKHSIQSVQLAFFGEKADMELKEKYRDDAREAIALVR